MEIPAHNILVLRNQTAAVLMASAVTELFPGALFVGGLGTPDRFFYDFHFPFEFQPNFITLIEERMRFILREKRPINLLEMVPANAAAMMRHRGQVLAADALLGVERAVIELCQIGDFTAYSPQPFLKELVIPYFKILEGFQVSRSGKKIIRIVGTSSSEKDVIKAIAKEPPVSSRSHLILSKEMEMFEPLPEEGLFVWRPKGEVLRRQLIRLWEELHSNFNFISTPSAFIGDGGEEGITLAHKEYFFQYGEPKLAEIALVSAPQEESLSPGLLAPKAFFADRAHLFCPDEKLLEECISSLQFILKIPKILDFEFEIVLSVSSAGTQKARSRGVALFRQVLEEANVSYTVEKNYRTGILASIDVRIADALGRRWTGPFLSIPEAPMPVGKGSMLIRSAYGSLERIAALLLEKGRGRFPLALAPVQVRVLVATGKTGPYAEHVCEVLRAQGLRIHLESSEGALKTRYHAAMTEKVPYVILLGQREETAKTLTVRAYGENEEQTLSLDEFCMRLKSEMRS